ncbi:MAG: ATP synthase F1 subunit gamma [Muribaculaceae bacterium]|nr:ATP synthase F1 subunit gamma [Muribaculaceae bacterium]
MATLRELKGRIGSVASSEKITGAMKMISSAKMHKAEAALKKQLPFRSQIEVIIGNLLSADAPVSSPLLEEHHVENLGVVVWGSDDGLCGAFNVNLFKILLGNIVQYRAKYGDNVKITVIPVGAKMLKAVQKLDDNNITVQPIEGIDSKSEGEVVKKFTENLRDSFTGGKLDRIDILYMNFKSISRQVPVTEQLLPISADKFNGLGQSAATSSRPYIFEPDAASIFRAVLPLYLLSLMQEVFTENRAAEQAARVMAMQSANDNAKKLLEQLQIEYNKLRQNSITTELLDILGGQVK